MSVLRQDIDAWLALCATAALRMDPTMQSEARRVLVTRDIQRRAGKLLPREN